MPNGGADEKELRVRLQCAHCMMLREPAARYTIRARPSRVQVALQEALFDEVKENLNPKLPAEDINKKKVLFWQPTTTKTKGGEERPNPRYSVAPMWSNVYYNLSFLTANPKDLAKVRSPSARTPARDASDPQSFRHSIARAARRMPRVQAMVKVAAAQPEVNNDVELILISPDGTEAPITLEALLDTEITMRAPKPATSSANTQKVADLEKRLRDAEDALTKSRQKAARKA